MKHHRSPLIRPAFWMVALALGGFALNLLLLIRRLSGGGLAGCGGGSSCDELLISRWAQVLGIPVTVFGLAVYLIVLLALAARRPMLLGACLGLLAGAAAWFIFVQAALIGRFCPWCMAAHGIGVALAILGLYRLAMAGGVVAAVKSVGLPALTAVLGIGLLQVYGPRPVTHRIEDVSSTAEPPVAAIHARGTGRKVAFDGGRKSYDLSAMPHLGRTDAKHVLVEYFDYSCAACRTMRGFLDALIANHPADICVVILPVPLERGCNHALGAGETEHPGACELARLALALWRTRPQAFGDFHHRLLDGASPAAARAMALERVPQAELETALRDPWIDELIRADINDWVAFSTGNRNLPKLLVSDRRILHGLPSGEADFIRVMERELGL